MAKFFNIEPSKEAYDCIMYALENNKIKGLGISGIWSDPTPGSDASLVSLFKLFESSAIKPEYIKLANLVETSGETVWDLRTTETVKFFRACGFSEFSSVTKESEELYATIYTMTLTPEYIKYPENYDLYDEVLTNGGWQPVTSIQELPKSYYVEKEIYDKTKGCSGYFLNNASTVSEMEYLVYSPGYDADGVNNLTYDHICQEVVNWLIKVGFLNASWGIQYVYGKEFQQYFIKAGKQV